MIDGWAKSDHFQCGLRAQDVLDRLDEMSKDHPDIQADRVALNAAIHAWSRQGSTAQAEAIFNRMRMDDAIKVECGDYNAMLTAYAKAGNARKAEDLFERMIQSEDVRPDLISYNCLLDSWGRSAEEGAAERAESILQTMEEKYETGESNICPNTKSYSSVASAFARRSSRMAIQKVEEILATAEAHGVPGDAYLYNALLDTWASSGRTNAAEEAEKKLLEMEADHQANSVSYNTVIKAWANSNAPDAAQRAESILHRMERWQATGTDEGVYPDVFTYATVVSRVTHMNPVPKQKFCNHCVRSTAIPRANRPG